MGVTFRAQAVMLLNAEAGLCQVLQISSEQPAEELTPDTSSTGCHLAESRTHTHSGQPLAELLRWRSGLDTGSFPCRTLPRLAEPAYRFYSYCRIHQFIHAIKQCKGRYRYGA